MMNDLFKNIMGIFVLIYLDDIIIYSEDESQHDNHVYQALQRLFMETPFLAHLDNTKPFIVETDASRFAIGAVLKQIDTNNDSRVIAFYSRQMVPAETNYKIYNGELLAIFAAFQEWRHFLQSEHTTIEYCDHRNLVYFMTTRKLNRRQARWLLFFMDFNFKIRFKPGKNNTVPEILSRLPQYEISKLKEYENNQVLVDPKLVKDVAPPAEALKV